MAYQCQLNEFAFFIARLYSIVLFCSQRAIQSRKSMLKIGQQLSLSLSSIHSFFLSLISFFFSPGAQCLDSDKVKAVQIICQQVNYIGMPVAELWAEVKPGVRSCPRKHCRSRLPEDEARSGHPMKSGTPADKLYSRPIQAWPWTPNYNVVIWYSIFRWWTLS